MLLSNPATVTSATLRIAGCDDPASIFFDNVYFYEADINLTDVESNFLFEYNGTNSNKVIPLNCPMIDAHGKQYSSEITLLPYTSAILMLDRGNQPPSIMNQNFQIEKKSPNGTVVGTIIASDPDAGQTLHYSIVLGNTNGAFALNTFTGVLSVADSAEIVDDFDLVVKVRDNGIGRISSEATITIDVKATGIEFIGYNKPIKVYPNPMSEEFIIEIEGNYEKLSFEILNLSGQIVFQGNLSEKTVVQTTNFPIGVYIVKLQNGRSFAFKKIVKI